MSSPDAYGRVRPSYAALALAALILAVGWLTAATPTRPRPVAVAREELPWLGAHSGAYRAGYAARKVGRAVYSGPNAAGRAATREWVDGWMEADDEED